MCLVPNDQSGIGPCAGACRGSPNNISAGPIAGATPSGVSRQSAFQTPPTPRNPYDPPPPSGQSQMVLLNAWEMDDPKADTVATSRMGHCMRMAGPRMASVRVRCGGSHSCGAHGENPDRRSAATQTTTEPCNAACL